MLAQEVLKQYAEPEIASSPWLRKELAESVVGLTPVERLVLCHVAGVGAHTSGFKCIHAQETIAREIGVTDRSVRKALKVLEERGLISYELTEIGAEYRDLSKSQLTLDDQRKRALYLDLGQVMLQANTEEGQAFYKFYQDYTQEKEREKQAKGGHKQRPQKTGQSKPIEEAPGQQETRPLAPRSAPACAVPATQPMKAYPSFLAGMSAEEQEERRAQAKAELKAYEAGRKAGDKAPVWAS